MATTVTKQVLENGSRNYRATYVINSDGSALTSYLAADGSAAGDMGVIIAGATYYPLAHLKIWRVRHDLPPSLNVRLTWEATSAQDAWAFYGFGKQDWTRDGGLSTIGIAGATGKLDFNIAAAAGVSGYGSIELWLKKDFQQ